MYSNNRSVEMASTEPEGLGDFLNSLQEGTTLLLSDSVPTVEVSIMQGHPRSPCLGSEEN
jgi:hypothetical protein